MSNYTQSTNFATKDALTSGDPLKIVKGTEINIEFVNIAVAVATKADLISPVLITPLLGTPTSGALDNCTSNTEAFGNSSTQLATTAFVQAAMAALHPVGSIYTSTSATNPNTSFGFGTWVQFGAGRVIIGVGGAFGAGATGGSNDAVAISHTHTATVTDPGHRHNTTIDGLAGTDGNFQSQVGLTTYSSVIGGFESYYARGVADSTHANASRSSGNTADVTVANSTTGVSGTNANLQPYIVVYMWNRTA